MTDEELRAAAGRLATDTSMSYWDGVDRYDAADDAFAVGRAYIAERDDTLLTFERLVTVAKLCKDEGYWDVHGDGEVWWEIGPLSFMCDSRHDDPGEPAVTVAVDWRVDGDSLPRQLIPRTVGELRTLCRLVGVELKETP
jgi:hypothetical protein